MAETIIAFKCRDFVLVAASGLSSHYYIKITDDEDKITTLDPHKMMVCSGENGPRVNFTEYIKANIQLNTVRQHGRRSSTPSTAAFIRQQLASSLRSRDGAYLVNSLLAGFDVKASEYDEEGGHGSYLYYLDYIGTLQEVNYGCHGYGGTFVTAILDQLWAPDLDPAAAMVLLQKCCDEVKKRIIISNTHFVCRVVSVKGIENLPQVH